MKKTKIVCTLGPQEEDREVLKELILNGMDVARFNFSHGTHESHKQMLDNLKELREELGIPVAALLDTKGPEIRTGLLKDGKPVTLVPGQEYILTTKEIIGDERIGYVTYEGLAEDVEKGSRILIDDGELEIDVDYVDGCEIHCTVVTGGELGEQKGINVPNVITRLPNITDKDRDDIMFGIEQGFDFIAASFVRNADAINEIRQILDIAGSSMKIIAKIENPEGVDNIDEIVKAADGCMIARGDLGVEIPPEKVPYVQKTIISKCNLSNKTVITATQMLDSMIRNPRPTRAEVTDVSNAVVEGTDCVMLSGETASGKYPVESLKMMVQIVEEAEKHLDYMSYRNRRVTRDEERMISNAVCYSTVATAYDLNASAIIAPSISGFTARLLSKYRPATEIYGLSPNEETVRQMMILWGVRPYQASRSTSTDAMIASSVVLLKEKKHLRSGDLAVVTAGVVNPGNQEPTKDTNIMRIVPIL